MTDPENPPAPPSWQDGEWLNPPVRCRREDGGLRVQSAQGSDFWRQTHYRFIRHSGHALLRSFEPESSIEVGFLADFTQLYDQAGLLVYADEQAWVKAGVEMSDGAPQVGAVVTRETSDWSCAPVPTWVGREVRIRASWAGDALTIRARVEREPWQLVRLAYFGAGAVVRAGLYCASPEREGLSVLFTDVVNGPPDPDLHHPPG